MPNHMPQAPLSVKHWPKLVADLIRSPTGSSSITFVSSPPLTTPTTFHWWSSRKVHITDSLFDLRILTADITPHFGNTYLQ